MFLVYQKLKDKIGWQWIFLIISVLVFLVVVLFHLQDFPLLIQYIGQTSLKIFPILLVVYLFLFLFSLLGTRNKFQHFLSQGSYPKKLIFTVFFGIISSGPIYIWYALLKKLHQSGLTWWHISAFAYARAIKIPMFPIMIAYFGLKFTLIFSFVLLVLALVQSLLVDFLYRNIAFLRK